MIISWFYRLNDYRDLFRDWVLRHSRGAKAKWTLFLVSFSESSFFLIPPDVILIAILVTAPKKYLYYAGLTTVASVLGALFGYLIGFFFFETIGQWVVTLYSLEEEMIYVGELFARNAFWAIFVSAFTPVPYKVFTIGAGFFRIDLFVFILASILGRGLRFLIIGLFMNRFGPTMGRMMYRYFNYLALIFVLGLLFLIIYFYLF